MLLMTFRGYGVELVFIGTKGGLTRYYHMSDDPRSMFVEPDKIII